MSGIFETKNRILKSLSSKPKTGKQLADELGLSQATLTQHLRELEERGLIREAAGSYSRRWKYYEVNSMEYERYVGSRSIGRNAAAAFAAAVAVIAIAAFLAGRLSSLGVAGAAYPGTTAAAVTAQGGNAAQAQGNIMPGNTTGAAFACPFIGYGESNITIDGISGFSQYTVSNYTDLVIAPGGTGTIRYTVHVAPLVAGSQGTAGQQALTLTNLVTLAHEARSNSSVSFTSYSAPGISVSHSPENYTEPYPMRAQNLTFSATFNVSRSAPGGTYWMVIARCEGYAKPMLMTVGSGPYNGTVRVVAQIYG